MKYIIDIPNDTTCINVLKYEDSKCVAARSYIIPDLTPYTEVVEVIEDEVWEFADYMCKMSPTERTLCFAFEYPSEVTTNLTYQEAKSLFEKWMKSENEIHVGDEVVVNGLRGVVMKLDEKGNVDRYFTSDGKTFGNITGFLNNEVKKTGRHFDEVEKLLEKMREEEEE